MEPWRIVFISMVQPAVANVDAYARSIGHETVAVVTTPGKQGRASELQEQGVERFRNLVENAPPHLDVLIASDKSRLAPLIRPLEPDVIFSMGFPWLLPKEVIEIPRLGIVNGHPSLLPRYRGPIPLAWAFRNGDRELGMSWHLMDEHFDTGPVLAQGSVPIDDEDQLEDLFPKLGVLSSQLLPQVFERLAGGERGQPQPPSDEPYAGFFEDDYVHVDWARPAREIHNQVRAWRGGPIAGGIRGPIAELDGEQLRLLRTSLKPQAGAREAQAGDGPLWVLETEPA